MGRKQRLFINVSMSALVASYRYSSSWFFRTAYSWIFRCFCVRCDSACCTIQRILIWLRFYIVEKLPFIESIASNFMELNGWLRFKAVT